MQISDEQKKTIRQWVVAGCTLSELQKKINEEFKLSLTFMDARFLVLDMGLQLKDRAATGGAMDISKAAPRTAAADADALPPGGGVAVTLDRVVKPGAVVSGTVTFSDGVNAGWMFDQAGRLGLSATQPGYRPTPEDLQSFQEELGQLLQSRGM